MDYFEVTPDSVPVGSTSVVLGKKMYCNQKLAFADLLTRCDPGTLVLVLATSPTTHEFPFRSGPKCVFLPCCGLALRRKVQAILASRLPSVTLVIDDDAQPLYEHHARSLFAMHPIKVTRVFLFRSVAAIPNHVKELADFVFAFPLRAQGEYQQLAFDFVSSSVSANILQQQRRQQNDNNCSVLVLKTSSGQLAWTDPNQLLVVNGDVVQV